MTDLLPVMISAVVLSTIVMAFAAKPLGNFIEAHPTTKMLALAFILLVGRRAGGGTEQGSTFRAATSISRSRSRWRWSF